jgi:peptidoglycan glycosyltransferase
VSLTEALTNSVNTVWGEVGEKLGQETMYRYMERFGFNEVPPVDYPPEQLTPSGVFARGGGLLPKDAPVDIGRVAIGQERLQVTPLQMAMVAAAIGNDGRLMIPRFVERVTSPDGRIKERVRPEEQSRVMSKRSADQVAGMMASVVAEGSGTAAQLRGVEVAGKTGTAEVDGGSANQAWFIAFAPADNPRIAIAATVERTQGTGGEVAAPIARQVLEVLLNAEGAPAGEAPAAGGF